MWQTNQEDFGMNKCPQFTIFPYIGEFLEALEVAMYIFFLFDFFLYHADKY